MGSDPHVVRVATFNARHGATPGHLVSHRGLIETCRALDADVLALQELDRGVVRSWFRNQPALIGRALGLSIAIASAKRTPLGGHQCNAILARGQVDQLVPHELPRRRGDERRVALLARVQLRGWECTVASVHLQHRDQGAASEQLAATVELLAARPGPRILAGDLNATAKTVEPTLAAAGYSLAIGGPTVPASNPRRQIDWIAADSGLVVVGTRVPRPIVGDHCPLVAELAVSS